MFSQILSARLFWRVWTVVQITSAFVSGSTQFMRARTDITGLSIMQFGLSTGFMLMNLLLALSAYAVLQKEFVPEPTHSERLSEVREGIAFYGVFISLGIAILLSIGFNPHYRWTSQDESALITTALLASIILAFTFTQVVSIRVHGIAGALKIAFANPRVRTALGMSFKSIPQIFLVLSLREHGTSGIPGLSMLLSNVGIWMRLVKVWRMGKATSWNEHSWWLLIGEVTNAVTWSIVSLAWLVYTYGRPGGF